MEIINKNLKIINKKYSLIDKIGEGSFGSIYKGQNIRTQEFVAIKVEPIINETKLLKNESIVYQYLNNIPGIPSVKWFGKDDDNYYMVINLLGESLQSIKNKKKYFSLKLVMQIGINIVELLKIIHDKGLVHRDIKPENFLLGLNSDRNRVFIIDFGLCKCYLIDGKHIPLKKMHNLIGSPTYASINAHKCIELSRRDDLESLGYMLIYFYKGFLQWQISDIENTSYEISQLKQYITNEDMYLPKVLSNYIRYVRGLEFTETPNYTFIIDSFKKEIENINIVKNS
jgi:serine/threonine protein kinase